MKKKPILQICLWILIAAGILVGTSHITGIIYEPWHYRYVGVELAQELKGTGLCLEAYLDRLTNDGTTCGNPNA